MTEPQNIIRQARDVLAKWRACDDCDGAGEYLDSDGDSFQPALEVVRCWRCDGTGVTKERPVELYEALDGVLTTLSLAKSPDQVSSWFPRLRDAIIAAEDRMSA